MRVPSVVVACRLPGAMRFGDRPGEALARFDVLVERARDLGGTVLATSFDAIAFAWGEDGIQEAVSLATGATHARGNDPAWASGIASGELEIGKPRSPGAPPLQWGEPLAVASALARMARPREVLVDLSVPEVSTHELLTNRARVGLVGGRRIRGFRVDARQAWRSVAAADVARMVDPPLVGRDEEMDRLMSATEVIILRADSGFGGSRVLAEVAARTKPSRSLTLTPFSVVHEPLGALRRAMAFVAATERITLPAKLHPVLDQLLGAQGATIEDAALLVAHQIQRRPGAPVPSLLLDDATDLDEPSLEACSRAIELLGGGVRVVARIDSMSQLPRTLARFSDGDEVVLGRLDSEAARTLAAACTGGAIEAGAGVQWARRGGGTPLGVVEAVAAGIAKGELLWDKDSLARLRKTAGSDIARPVGYWIARRAETLREGSRDVLIALAHLGGEASLSEIADVVMAVAPEIDLTAEIVALRRGRWIRETRQGVFVLATRAQREAIFEFSRNDHHAREWRMAVAKTLEAAPGTLRRAEAAQHAARAGMGEWAARLAMAAARTAAQAGLEEAASTLAAFAGVQSPGSADLDLGALPLDDDSSGSVGVVRAMPISDSALMAAEELPLSLPPHAVPGAVDATELPLPPAVPEVPVPGIAEVDRTHVRESASATITNEVDRAHVREAAQTITNEADELVFEPDSHRVNYHDILEAARELRESPWSEVARRSLADGANPATQRRGLLALARAYAQEGRSSEALIFALDALARAREASDVLGVKACLLFLARLYERTERVSEAATLKNAALAAG